MNSIINKINHWGYLSEQKTGIFLTSIFLSVLLLATAMLYVAPDFNAGFHGAYYAKLSLHPFDVSTPNPVHYRILAPLIGYLTFLKGDLFFFIPLLFAVLLLSSIYINYRKINFSVLESLNMAGIIAFSCAILIPIRAAGYPDTVTYYFIFLAFTSVQKPKLAALFFTLALLNHESSAFVLPGLIAYQNYRNGNKTFTLSKNSLYFIIGCLPYLIYHYYVSINCTVEYNLSFYFLNESFKTDLQSMIPLFIPGLFFTFKLFWIYPVWIIGKSIQTNNYAFIIVLLSIIIGVILQLLIAFDISRMLCLLFPAILLSAEQLKLEMEGNKFAILSTVVILINFAIPQYFASNFGLERLFHLPFGI